jgi:hypothetical protein
MWKKILILSLSVALLLVISAPISSVYAKGSKNINWRIAGTIVQLLDITIPAPGAEPAPHSLINLTARGAPGPARITLLSKSTGPPGVTGTSLTCEDEVNFTHIADVVQNDFVAIFPDQSLLFASIDNSEDGGGILCIDAATFQTTYFIVKMKITGGKKRFEGASGYFTAEGYGYPGFSSEGTLVGENGRIKGRIDFN